MFRSETRESKGSRGKMTGERSERAGALLAASRPSLVNRRKPASIRSNPWVNAVPGARAGALRLAPRSVIGRDRSSEGHGTGHGAARELAQFIMSTEMSAALSICSVALPKIMRRSREWL